MNKESIEVASQYTAWLRIQIEQTVREETAWRARLLGEGDSEAWAHIHALVVHMGRMFARVAAVPFGPFKIKPAMVLCVSEGTQGGRGWTVVLITVLMKHHRGSEQ